MDALDDAFREGYELGQWELITAKQDLVNDLSIEYANAVVKAGRKLLNAVKDLDSNGFDSGITELEEAVTAYEEIRKTTHG